MARGVVGLRFALPEALRRHFLCAVAGAVFHTCRGTSQQNIAFQMFLQLQTLGRLLSRPVAAGASSSLKDVAASQCVCSRGADNRSSIFLMILPSGVTFAVRVTGDAMVDVDCIVGCADQLETVLHRSARDSSFFVQGACGQGASLYSRTSDGLKTCAVDLKEQRRGCYDRWSTPLRGAQFGR